MEIVLGKTAGFCYGVTRAIDGAKEALEKEDIKYCIGEIVHNTDVINDLEEKGLKFIDSIEEAKDKVIIRAHGATKETYEKAKELNIEVKDLTCPKVLKIHEIAEKYSKKGYYIILVGSSNHPEVMGIKSFCLDNSCIVKEEADVDYAVSEIKNLDLNKVLVISQTTFNSKKFDDIVSKIKDKISKRTELKVVKTICPATEMRQKETEEIAKEVDYMIIVGDKKSSNTNKLYEIALKYCNNTILINNYEEINLRELRNINVVGIMAGASTPRENIEKIFEKIIFMKQ